VSSRWLLVAHRRRRAQPVIKTDIGPQEWRVVTAVLVAYCGSDGVTVDAVDVVQFQCDTFRSLGKDLSAQVVERNEGQPTCSWYPGHGLAVDSWLYMPLAV
jgi:hypothetical protein